MIRSEIEGLEDVATGCTGCCPRIAELASNQMAWDRQVRESLEILDDTDPAEEGDEDCLSTAQLLKNPPWDEPPGKRRVQYPRVPKGRKKYRIRLTRLLRMPADMRYSFRKEAQSATKTIIRSLKGKLKTEAELAYKFSIEVQDGILYTMEKFLQLPSTIEAQITTENLAQFVQYSGLLMVFNDHSKNTPVRLCYNPAQKRSGSGSNETVNSNIAAPKSLVAKLRPTYFRMSLSAGWGTGDLEAFYLKTRLDAKGALANTIWLQLDDNGVPTLTSDPDKPLIECVKTSPCFGAVDSGSHAQIALMATPRLYMETVPDGPDKIPAKDVDMIRDDVNKSFVDDVAFTAALKEIKEERGGLPWPEDNAKRLQAWKTVRDRVLEKKIYTTIAVTDKFGYRFKSVSLPANKKLEELVNTNPLLLCAQPKEPRCASRPAAADVCGEATGRAHQEAAPLPQGDNPAYLGIDIDNQDRLSLKTRLVNVGKKRMGIANPDKGFQSAAQLEEYFAKGSTLTLREVLSLIQQDYDPMGSLNGITRVVGKTLYREVNKALSRPGEVSQKKWEWKMPDRFKPACVKYLDLLFKVAQRKHHRYAFVEGPVEDLQLGAIALTDGGQDAGSELVYIKSWCIRTGRTKVHLITTNTKQCPCCGRSIPLIELDAADRGSSLLLEVIREILECTGIKPEQFKFVLQAVDSQSTIFMARSHGSSLKVGFRKQAARIQVNFCEIEKLLGPHRGYPNIFENLVYIDQFQHIGPKGEEVGTNYADYLTKVDLDKDTVDSWLEKWDKIQDGGWINLPDHHWKHLYKGTTGHHRDGHSLNIVKLNILRTKITLGGMLGETPDTKTDLPVGMCSKAEERRNQLVYGICRAKFGLSPRTEKADLFALRQEFPIPHGGDHDLWVRYFNRMDENRLLRIMLAEDRSRSGKTFGELSSKFIHEGREDYQPSKFVREGQNNQDYEHGYWYSENLYKDLGAEPALKFLQGLEVEHQAHPPNRVHHPPEHHLRARAEGSAITAARMAVTPPEGVTGRPNLRDEKFFSSVLRVGQVNPERLRSLVPGGINRGRWKSQQRVAGLVLSFIHKLRTLASATRLREQAALPQGEPHEPDRLLDADHPAHSFKALDKPPPEGQGTYPNLRKDLTAMAEREDQELRGMWALAAESAAPLDYKLVTNNRLLRNLVPSTVMYSNGFYKKEVPVLLGRETRVFCPNGDEKESQFMIKILAPGAPLCRQVVHLVHQELGCCKSKETYCEAIMLKGYWWPGASNLAHRFRTECPACTIQVAGMRKHPCKVVSPGADYTVRTYLEPDPMSVVVVDETGPVRLADGQKVCALMAVELGTGRVHLIAMRGMTTEDLIIALGRLQAIRGGLDTIVMDAASSHMVVANSAAICSTGGLVRKKLSTKAVQGKLQDMNIQLKVVPANAHHQAGHAENVSKQCKVLTFNVLQGMPIQDGIHYQGILDVMAGTINNRVRFIDHDGGIHTSNTFMQTALRVSQRDPQDLTTLPNTKSKKIIAETARVVQENRRILTLFASQYSQSLLAWQMTKYGADPKIQNGDVVIVLDKIVLHHYHSARRAIGRVMQTSESGNAFRIQMVSQGKGDGRPHAIKHRKHLLLLAKSREEASPSGLIQIDPWADAGVSEMMSRPKLDMEARFFEAGLSRLPSLAEVVQESETFKHPDDVYTAHDFADPLSAQNLHYPGAFRIIKDRLVDEDPGPAEVAAPLVEPQEEMTGPPAPPPVEPAAPPVETIRLRDPLSGSVDAPVVVPPPAARTASGRVVKPRVRLNL